LLTRIGETPARGDAVELLVDCHARIRHFVALAGRIAERGAEDPSAVPDAARAVVRYFTEALPLHARDEEESIVPRLRGREPALDAALEVMQREHVEHEAALGRLVAACRLLAEAPGRIVELAPAVGREAAFLAGHFEAHLANEEQVIFPALRRLLDPAADASLVAEIRGRREPRREAAAHAP
jgi:iron-sulfur cluster repair protein YtfE (RIC family)